VADVLADRGERRVDEVMLILHRVKNLKGVWRASPASAHQWPELLVLDRVVMVELIGEQTPADAEPLMGGRIVGYDGGGSGQGFEVPAKGVVQGVHDGEVDGAGCHEVLLAGRGVAGGCGSTLMSLQK
jgi:hypothetical protein